MNKAVLALVFAALAFPAPGCTAADPGASADENVVNVSLSGMTFTPASVTVKVGQTVRWTWNGGTHNVVSGTDCGKPDGQFRSREPQPGGSFDKLFEKAGTFPYYCESHCSMGMKGTVVVEP